MIGTAANAQLLLPECDLMQVEATAHLSVVVVMDSVRKGRGGAR